LGIRVLVIDDDLELLDLLERFLVAEHPEFQVECVTSAQDAIQILDESSFDVIVSDYHLGPDVMNGLELLEWLRDAGNRVPFVMFTGKSREEVAIRALNLGADFYLRKDEDSFQTLISELGHHIQKYVGVSRLENALAQIESRFQSLYDSSMDGILVTNLSGVVSQCNQRFGEMLGYEMNQIKGASFRDLAPKEWHRILTEVGNEVQNSGHSRIIEAELKTKDGSKLPVAISSWRMDDEEGRPIGAWVLVRDVSLSKVAEKALKENEARFRTLFEDSPDAIVLFDSDGSLVNANRAVIEMYGLNGVESIRGYRLFEDPDFPSEVKDSLRRGVSARFEREYSFESAKEAGLYDTSRSDTALFEVIAAPFGMDDAGEVHGYMIITRELTESRSAEKELETLRRRFQAVFENTPVGLAFQRVSLADDGQPSRFEILEANASFARITGLDEEGFCDLSIEELYANIEKPKHGWASVLSNVIRTSLPFFHEAPAVSKNEWYSITIYSPAPNLAVTVLADITEQVRAYELLGRQREELSEFAHHMKHDITSSLLKMEAYAEILETDFNEKDLDRLKQLIEEVKDLLSHSVQLADAGLVIDEKCMTNLDKISREVADEVLGDSVAFKQQALPEVMADSTKVSQVFRNLFENAVIHGEATRVWIELSHSDDGVVISVSNDGRQVPAEDREHLFTRGFSTGEGRRGLGLVIVKKLVEAHGWGISLADKDVTTFEISIPKERMYE
jgi:PAS domain S-box-containing protein